MSRVEDLPPSPVPSDGHLWPGELPFTCFGRFGKDMLDLRVFDQDEWWVDRNGRAHLLVGPDGTGGLGGMSSQYRENVLQFLVQNAAYFHEETVLRFIIQRTGDRLLRFPDKVPVGGVDDFEDLTGMEPRQWLEQTPLVRRLRELQGT